MMMGYLAGLDMVDLKQLYYYNQYQSIRAFIPSSLPNKPSRAEVGSLPAILPLIVTAKTSSKQRNLRDRKERRKGWKDSTTFYKRKEQK